MEPSPSRLGHLEELASGQGGIEVIARQRSAFRVFRGKFLADLLCQTGKARIASLLVKQAERMNGREVHLGAAGIHKPRVSKVRAEKITNPFRAAQSALVSGLFVP